MHKMDFTYLTQQFNDRMGRNWGTNWLDNKEKNKFSLINYSSPLYKANGFVPNAPPSSRIREATPEALKPMKALDIAPKLDTKTLMPMTKKPMGFAGFAKGLGGIGGIGKVAGAIDTMLPDTADNTTTAGINIGYDAASSALMAIPGGQVIGGAMKIAGLLGQGVDAITGGIDNATNTSDKILSSKLFNWNIGALNSATKKTVQGSDTDLSSTITRGYQPTDEVATTDIGGITNKFKKIFGKGKVDLVKNRQKSVDRVNRENALKSISGYIAQKNELASSNSIADVANKNRQALFGGQNTYGIAAKHGAKLLDLKNIKAKANRNIKLKNGGVIPQNVIPSGQFHSRKHNIEGLDNISNKGIPVISMEDGGEIKQHAEIEVNEIIFHKQLTDSIEKLYKEYENGNDSAALEAGKLLVYEILENTQDNTGIIKTI